MLKVKILKASHSSVIYIADLTGEIFRSSMLDKNININMIFNAEIQIGYINFDVDLTIDKLNNIITLLKSADNTIVSMGLTILNDNKI